MNPPSSDPAAAATPGVAPAQAQHVGRRDSQQDAFGFSDSSDPGFVRHAGHLAVLADGMGGMRNGAWAATHGVQAFVAAYQAKTADETIPDALRRALTAANAVVHDEAGRLGTVDRMGSTLVAAVVHGLELHWISAGDSRVYLGEGGHLMRLSSDHSFGEFLRMQVHRGAMTAGEAMSHPLRNALTSYLGRPAPIEFGASTAAVQLRPGTWVLLCSDGLTQALDDDAIAAHLHGNAQEACEMLLQSALARGLRDQDNITAVLLHVPRSDRAPDAGSSSRAVYRRATPAAPAVDAATNAPPPPPAASPAPLAPPPAGAATAARPRWREPLGLAGAAAALAALVLLWLALSPAPPPAPAAPLRQAPSVDLLAKPPPAAPAQPGSAATGPGTGPGAAPRASAGGG